MSEDGTKACPFCGEEIKAVAIKCKHCGERLDRVGPPMDDTVPAGGAAPGPASYGIPPGTRLGSFVLREVLGVGGMGTVHRAEHARLGSQVAIKVLAPHLARDPALLERFEGEARLQANLRHPGIVAVHDFLTEAGVAAFVMELVEGETLEAIIRKHGGPLELGRVLELFLPVLDALAFAHGQGIVHRDVKPSNVLVTAVAGKEVVKVADFGIAKALGASRRTTTGAKMGTLYYMSPEQCRGDRDIDGRADVYALGATLFELVTGRVPFEGTSEWEMMCAHIEDPPPRPTSLNPSLSPAVEGAILRALAKDREERFQSVEELRAALAEAAEAEGIAVADRRVLSTATEPEVEPPTPAVEAPKPGAETPPPRRRRTFLALAVVGLVVVLGGFGGAAALRPGWLGLGSSAAASSSAAGPDAAAGPAPDAGRPSPPAAAARVEPLSATASSVYRSKRGGATPYEAGRAVDGLTDTWWQEGEEGDGEGQRLHLAWSGERLVTEIRLVPGYAKQVDDRFGDRWTLNNRLEQVRIVLSSGRTIDRTLEDRRGWQSVPVSPPAPAAWAEVQILSVYPGFTPEGVRVHDSGIAEVEVWALPAAPAPPPSAPAPLTP